MIDPSIVLGLILEEIKPSSERPPIRSEIKAAQAIIVQLKRQDIASLEIFEEEEELAYDEDEIENPEWDGDESEDSSPHRKEPKTELNYRFSGDKYATEDEVRKAIAHMRDTESGTRPLSSMSAQFRKKKKKKKNVKHDMEKLRLFEKNGLRPLRNEALAMLKHLLEEKVMDTFNDRIALHDRDLFQLAIRINEEEKLVPGFHASPTWARNFKKSVGIVSRHVTTWVSKKTLRIQAVTDALTDAFVDEVQQEIANTKPALVLNCDQSGFVKELHSSRSLSRLGEKTTERLVQDISATKHSFTIMPSLAMDGTLLPKLFVQLQEPHGQFPHKGHYKARNLEIVAGTSHMMTKDTMLHFFRTCVMPSVTSSALIILDSWSSFKDHAAIVALAPPSTSVTIKNIPPGATSKIQPLDVYFFHFMKDMYRRFISHVLVHGLEYDLHNRDHMLMMMSAIFRIFSHDRFLNFRRYSWFKAGYTPSHSPFETPIEYAFPRDSHEPCNEHGCKEKIAFIRCPYCQKSYCFKHFLTTDANDIHWC